MGQSPELGPILLENIGLKVAMNNAMIYYIGNAIIIAVKFN